MHEDFRGQDLRGRSFKGLDLSYADFSDARLGSCDFSGATLIGAKFCRATMGHSLSIKLFGIFTQILAGTINGIVALLAGMLVITLLIRVVPQASLPNAITATIMIVVIMLVIVAFIELNRLIFSLIR